MKKDVRFVASPHIVVEGILDLAEVGPKDTVFDLGSGDGRLVIAAAGRGATAIGIEIDPSLVARSLVSATAAGVEGLTSFRTESFHQTDLTGATVVIVYLMRSVNRALKPKLLRELLPGTRLISHSFPMPEWKPETEVMVDTKLLFRWTIPKE